MSFPTTGILDSFNRANENPLSDGGKWTQFLTNPMQIVSDQCVGTAASGAYNGASWNNSSFTNGEVYVTFPTPALVTGDQAFLYVNFNFSSGNGYVLDYYENTTGGDNISVNISTGFSLSSLINGVNRNISTGDSLGLSAVSGVVTMWYKASGGSWTSLGSKSDSTYTSGEVGFACEYSATSMAFTNFGGGSSVLSSRISQLMLLGVG